MPEVAQLLAELDEYVGAVQQKYRPVGLDTALMVAASLMTVRELRQARREGEEG